MNEPNQVVDPGSSQRRSAGTALLGGLLVLAMFAVLGQWKALASTRDRLTTAQRQTMSMRDDADLIRSLRAAPKVVAGRARGSEELLATIEKALATAGIDRSRWQDSVPQPTVRLPGEDYSQHSTRLYFDGLTLRELASFAVSLDVVDPTLSVSAVSLSNRQIDSPHFAGEVSVSYLVYSRATRSAFRDGEAAPGVVQ